MPPLSTLCLPQLQHWIHHIMICFMWKHVETWYMAHSLVFKAVDVIQRFSGPSLVFEIQSVSESFWAKNYNVVTIFQPHRWSYLKCTFGGGTVLNWLSIVFCFFFFFKRGKMTHTRFSADHKDPFGHFGKGVLRCDWKIGLRPHWAHIFRCASISRLYPCERVSRQSFEFET